MWVLIKRFFVTGFLPLLFLVLLTSSCGSGGGGGSSSSVDVAGGGIGGTGAASGVVTKFGSIFLGNKEYHTTQATFSVDQDDTATQNDLAVGMKVVITGTLTGSGGTADSVVYEPEIKGVVESINAANQRFGVMGQTVAVDGNTKFKRYNEAEETATFSDIQIDDVIEVSGFFDASGDLLATYVELEDPATQTLKIKGAIENLDPVLMNFTIKNLTVDYTSFSNMQIHEGDFIEVHGQLQGGVLIADHLEMEDMTPNVGEGEEMELEGIITAVPSANNIYYLVNGMSVEVTGGTQFETGSEADLTLNLRIEVSGTVSGGILVAEEIEIKE